MGCGEHPALSDQRSAARHPLPGSEGLTTQLGRSPQQRLPGCLPRTELIPSADPLHWIAQGIEIDRAAETYRRTSARIEASILSLDCQRFRYPARLFNRVGRLGRRAKADVRSHQRRFGIEPGALVQFVAEPGQATFASADEQGVAARTILRQAVFAGQAQAQSYAIGFNAAIAAEGIPLFRQSRSFGRGVDERHLRRIAANLALAPFASHPKKPQSFGRGMQR
ncbi:MAG: hypothetical protein CVT75_10025 [Alphaproteobacteria bacterium HGW-Alphaproteobacteria-14]|nr:MAG: hypothetical protein CVT75_10025 [Alphaproteobacteria bacterium HGW-Alphaproteobacteria-14]